MAITPDEAARVYRDADRLYSLEQVEAAIDRMAGEIHAQLGERNPLVLCVMNGAVVPFGRLVSRMDFPMQLDYCHATRYRGETRGGDLHWLSEPRESLADRTVLIVDDILDEGYTLHALVGACNRLGAAGVHTAVMVVKRHDRGIGLEADFWALEVADRYVFGYGMDYKGYLRNVPGIFAVGD